MICQCKRKVAKRKASKQQKRETRVLKMYMEKSSNRANKCQSKGRKVLVNNQSVKALKSCRLRYEGKCMHMDIKHK